MRKKLTFKNLITLVLSALCLFLQAGCAIVGPGGGIIPPKDDGSFVETKAETKLYVDFSDEKLKGAFATAEGNVPEGWTNFCSYKRTDEGVLFDCTRRWQSQLWYTLPQPMSFSLSDGKARNQEAAYSITFRYKMIPASNYFVVYLYPEGEDRDYVYVNCNDMASRKTEGDWTVATIESEKLRMHSDATKRLQNVSKICLKLAMVGSATWQSISYTTYATNFNQLKSGTENEYVLADFNSSQYKTYLSQTDYTLGTLYDVEDGMLSVQLSDSQADNWAGSITYTLGEELPVSQMATLKYKADGFAYVQLVGKSGKTLRILPSDSFVTREDTEDGLYLYTVDMAGLLASDQEGISLEDALDKIQLSCYGAGSSILYDEITYTKKGA